MANDGGIDVLMKISISGGSVGMDAESLTDFAPLVSGDPLLSDFKVGQFCELTSFDFSAGAEKSLKPKKKKKNQTKETAAATPPQATRSGPRGELVARMVAQIEDRPGLERVLAKRVEDRESGDVVDMREVSYERVMDVASTELFKALTECKTIARITIVKRKGAGTSVSGLGYLRLDFEEVLMTELEWADKEHVMMEDGSFIYRRLKITYKTQKADGTLEHGSSADWKMKPNRG